MLTVGWDRPEKGRLAGCVGSIRSRAGEPSGREPANAVDGARPVSRTAATDAVKPCTKFAPTDRTDLAGAEHPGDRGARRAPRGSPSASWSGAPNSAVPRPLQVNTSAPSADRSAIMDRRSSSADSASRTWNWTVVPTSTSSPTAIGSDLRSAPSTPRTRKSPRPNSSRCSSMTRPMCSPFAARARSASSSRLDLLDESIERRPPGELVDDVPLGPGHGHGARRTVDTPGTRPVARGTDGGEQHPDRPVGVELAVEHQPVAAALAGRRGHAADHGRGPGAMTASSSSTASTGNENGS